MKGLCSKLSVKLIAILAAVVVAAGGMTVALVKAEVFTAPETMVERALNSIAEEETERASESVFGWMELMQKAGNQGAEVELKLAVSDIPGDLFGLDGMKIPKAGISVSARNDAKNNKQSGVLSLELADTKLATVQLYADSKELQLAIPQFFTPVLSLPYASDELANKAKESYLGELLGLSEEDINMLATVFQDRADSEELEEELQQLIKSQKELKKKLYAQMTAEKNGNVEIAEAGNAKCKNYKATFPKEAVEEYLDGSSKLLMNTMEKLWKQSGMEEMIERLKAMETTETEESLPTWESIKTEYEEMIAECKKELSDVTLSVDVKNKRVARLVAEMGAGTCEAFFGLEGSYMDNLTFSMTKQGETEPALSVMHTTENGEEMFSSRWEVSLDGEAFVLDSLYDKISGDFHVTLSADDTSLKLSGVITELKKGEYIAVEINSVSLTEYDTVEIINVTYSFSLKVLDGTVEPLSNEAKDIFAMGESDWNSLFMEVYGKLFGVLGGLNGLFQ